MKYKLEITEFPEYLNCQVSLEFTPENATGAIHEAMHECISTGKYNLLMDFTSFKHPVSAVLKLLSAINIEGLIIEHEDLLLKHPRFAILGEAPAMTTYKPGQEYFKSLGKPLGGFTDKEKALKWLLSDKPTA